LRVPVVQLQDDAMATLDHSNSRPRPSSVRSPAYRRIEAKIAAEQCVILDGGIATEL